MSDMTNEEREIAAEIERLKVDQQMTAGLGCLAVPFRNNPTDLTRRPEWEHVENVFISAVDPLDNTGKMVIKFKERAYAQLIVEQLKGDPGMPDVLEHVTRVNLMSDSVSEALWLFWRGLNAEFQVLPAQIDYRTYRISILEPTQKYAAAVIISLASTRMLGDNQVEILWGWKPPVLRESKVRLDPLNWGNMKWKPELVTALPVMGMDLAANKEQLAPVKVRPDHQFDRPLLTGNELRHATLLGISLNAYLWWEKQPVSVRQAIARLKFESNGNVSTLGECIAGAYKVDQVSGIRDFVFKEDKRRRLSYPFDPTGQLEKVLSAKHETGVTVSNDDLAKSIQDFTATLKDDFPVGRLVPQGNRLQVGIDGAFEVYLTEPRTEAKVRIISPDGQVTEATLVIDPSMAFTPGAGLLEKPVIPSMRAIHDPSVSQAEKNIGAAFGYKED